MVIGYKRDQKFLVSSPQPSRERGAPVVEPRVTAD